MDRIKKIDFPSHRILSPQAPQSLNLGLLPHPQNTCMLFEVFEVILTDTVFSFTYRCLLGVFTVTFLFNLILALGVLLGGG